MRIRIKTKKHRLNLIFPLWGFIIKKILKGLDDKEDGGNFELTKEQIKIITQAIKKAKKDFKGLELICIDTKENEKIRIIL